MFFDHCVVIFYWSSWTIDCMLLPFENMYVSGVASFISTDEQLQKTGLLFFHAGYASFPFLSLI